MEADCVEFAQPGAAEVTSPAGTERALVGWAEVGGGDEFSAVDLKTQPAADWCIPAAAALVIRVVLELGTNLRVCPRLFVCGSAVAWALASNPGFASARGLWKTDVSPLWD